MTVDKLGELLNQAFDRGWAERCKRPADLEKNNTLMINGAIDDAYLSAQRDWVQTTILDLFKEHEL